MLLPVIGLMQGGNHTAFCVTYLWHNQDARAHQVVGPDVPEEEELEEEF